MEEPITRKINMKTGLPELKINERVMKTKPNNTKGDLRYAKNLPAECDNCRFRPMEEGGNGVCTKYVKGSLCIIRTDIAKMIEKFGGRDVKVVQLMEEEFRNNFEFLQFQETMEDQSGTINPDVTKRISALANLGKILSEIKTKTQTIEVKEKTLTDDQRNEIARTIKMTKQVEE